MITLDTYPIPKLLEFFPSQRFGEDINNLIFSRLVQQLDVPLLYQLSDEMMVNFNMLGPCMEHRILCQLDRTLIVTVQL